MISKLIFWLILLIIGAVAGHYFLADVQKREPLTISGCDPVCFNTSETLGLVAAVGLKIGAQDYVVDKIMETDKTLAIKHPASKEKNHIVIIPKKDVKNIAEVSEDDRAYLIDAIAVAQRVITDKKLTKYQLVTNGPGFQDVAYLHFHLVGE